VAERQDTDGQPSERLLIERLGQRGDGVASGVRGPVYVAGALPGETVLAEVQGERGRLLAVEEPSQDRVEPYCPYYGRCGGCAVQHLAIAPSLEWKRGLLVQALRERGLDAPVEPCLDAHGAGRRRVILHVRRAETGIEAGFMEPRSHRLVAIERCPVTVPALARAPLVARRLGAILLTAKAKPLDAQVTASDAGLDVDLRGHGPASAPVRLALVEAAEALDLARLSLHGDLIVERRGPTLAMGRARITPPPGGFLQATAAGEAALARLVGEGAAPARRVVDLFAGCGPFALRLAEGAAVHAVDGHEAGLGALTRAARATPGLKPVTTETRDLFRRPLLPAELERFDAALFDPPRAGAEAQARELARSGLRRIVGVSCNAASFARDAAILIGAGYALERVTPVDQFRHAAHVELVGVFRR